MRLRVGLPGRLRAATRLGWGLTDQAVSSLTNFICAATAAHVLSASELGAYSLAFVTYAVALNCSRGLATDPLMVRHSASNPGAWRSVVRQCTGTAVTVGFIGGLLMIGCSLLLPEPTKGALLAMGLVLPVLLLQDSWRYAFFVARRGHQAALNDLVWAAALIPALAIIVRTPDATPFGFVLVWGCAAAVSAVVGMWQARVIPAPARTSGWLRSHGDLGFRYMAEGMSGSLANQLRTYGIGLIVGLVAVGHLQVLNTLLGPFTIVLLGTGTVVVPELGAILRRSSREMLRACFALSVGLGAVAAAWGLFVWVTLPDGLGNVMVGPVWEQVRSLVPLAALGLVCVSPGAGAGGGLHALGAARRSLRAMVLGCTLGLCLTVVGAVAAGLGGALAGAAVAAAISSWNWWRELRAAVRDHDISLRRRLDLTHGGQGSTTVAFS